MIGTMEKTLEEAAPEKEEALAPKQKKADIRTPSITSFFKPPSKPSPKAQESKVTDLRNYFQVSKTGDVADRPKISSAKNGQDDSKVEKASVTEDGDGIQSSTKDKLKRGKRNGETKRVSKKPKKQKEDSHHKSDDDDFESPPPNRRKRKSRLDSDSIPDFIDTEDGKQRQDPSENAGLEPKVVQDEMEVSESDATETPCSGKDALNNSTVVSYEDFLKNSMADGDNGESDIETQETFQNDDDDDAETKKGGPIVPAEDDHPSDSVMLIPPDSRCSQESPKGYQPATPPANQDARKEDEANDSDTCLRKVITVKAQVHSPIDGRDKDSSPGASPMLNSDIVSRKGGFGPRRLISNVSVLDSSPELTLISVETKEEPKRTGPVYSIFKPKPVGPKKEVTKKEPVKENKQEEAVPVKDLPKKEVKFNDAWSKEKKAKEMQEESSDNTATVNKQVDENNVKGKKEKKVNTKQGSSTGKDETMKKSKKGAAARNGSASQENSSLALKPSTKSKSSVKNKEEKGPEEDSSVPTRRVLRARVAKRSTDADSSMDEFDDVKPMNTKPNKQTKKATQSSNKTTAKAEVRDKKKGLDRSKASEPPKFKSSLMTGIKGQGSIKLKLTAIKASPKKNSKVAKAQQLLQKAKKGHQTTSVPKTQASRFLLKKKNIQSTFPRSNSKVVPSKVMKANPEGKKGKVEKNVGDGAQKETPRRRSSSRNKPKTPPKAAAKLAPIFTKQGQLAAAKKFKQESIMAAIADSISLDEASRDSLTDSRDTMSDLSGPVLGFNMLEQLKMETTLPQRDNQPQLTKACHVLQKDNSNPLWKLPRPELGIWKLRHDLESKPNLGPSNLKLTPSSSSISSSPSIYHFKLSIRSTSVSESDKKTAMDEILKANPKFPVQKIFKMYQAKKNGETQKKEEDRLDTQVTDQTNQESAASSKIVASGKASRLSRGKRKAEDVTDEDNNTRRKMARRSGRGCARRSLETSLDGEPSQAEAGEAEERSLRRSSRRSSRRLSTTEEDEEKKVGDGKESEEQKEEKNGEKDTIVEESQEEKRRAGMLWTERYQPNTVSEMIGNATICKKFSSWMTEWKKKTQRMKEKTRNARGKNKSKSKGSKRIDSDDESDDDFCCYSDSDDSDEEDGLCNTILLSGPHGVGKTSLVYACAQELGFEVFEVNASSRRNGRQILAQLGEGTQSHQVARQPGLSSARFFNMSPSKSGSAIKSASPKKKKKPALPKAFAGFVKVGSSSSLSSKRSPVKKPSVKKSPKKAVKQSPIKKSSLSQVSQSGITKSKVTSTSLILFDEVDIIFEEDKGFLSTVMSFMESSKRPIVLTTSDPRFSFSISARYDELTFKPPPLNPLVSHLKLLCLAEDLPISHHDLRLVAEFFDRDIRRCLHHLQFWVCSGAMPKSDAIQHGPAGNDDETGLKRDPSKDMLISQSVTDNMDTSKVGGSESQMKGVVDELTQELIDIETRIIAVGEYYSMKGYKPQDVLKIMDDMGLTDKTSKDTCNETNSIQEIMGCSYRTGLGNYCGLFESIAGLGNIAGPVIDSLHLLKQLADPIILAGILRAFHDVSINAAHCNLPQILSSLSTSKDNKSKTASPSSNNKSSIESTDHELTEDEKRTASKLGGDLITIMSEHADRMSEMDTVLPLSQRQDSHLNRYGNNEWWHPLLLPGLNDKEGWIGEDYELVDVRPCDSRGEWNIVDMNCCLEAMSLRDCVKRCRRTVGAMQDDTRWDEIQRRVLPSHDESLLRIQAIKSDATLRETSSAVVRRLPAYLYTHHSALTLDYLPMLRGICRYEELRRETNLKRRFFHYLDSISFCLRPVTHTSLASILNQTQRVNIKQSL